MFSAGAVSATLSGNFNPAGFMAFDSSIRKSAALMEANEKKMVASHGRMGKAMSVAGKAGGLALAGGVLAAGIAIAKSVKLAADFEQQLSRLKATTNATSSQMKQFKKDAMEAGAATKFSALDAAKAQVELAKGGLSVKNMSGGLKSALALAAAGEMDLAEAAATTVNAMKQFKLGGEDAMHIADGLATAANTTTADVHHFAMALTQGGAAAKAAGMSFDETIAILEAFADNSVKGSDAGTSMKTMLTQLAAPTDKQKTAAKGLNLELWNQQGRLKALPEIARQLDGAFGGLTNQQRLAAAATIAGTDGMRGLIALYDSSPSKMQGYLDGLKKEGTAAEVAAEKQDNLKGKIENLKGSLETAGIALGEGLLPGLTEGAEKITAKINEMSAAGDFEKMGKDIGSVVEQLVAAGPAIAEGFKVGFAGLGAVVDAGKVALLGLMVPIATIGKLMLAFGKTANAISGVVGGPKFDLKDLESDVGKMDRLVKGLAADLSGKEVKLKIKGDASDAVAALRRVQGMGLSAKVMKVLGKDISAAAKIKQLRAMGIPDKTARLLANNAQALSAVGSTQAAINSLQGKTVRVDVITTSTNIIKNKVVQALGKAKGRASGRGPGDSELALTGEGIGAELAGNLRDGFVMVDRPTLMNLGPDDSVIPFGDPSQSGRALGLLLDMLGIKGYAKGKKAPQPKKKNAPKNLPIPAAVQFGAVPEDELDKSRDDAREAYQKRKDRVHDIDVDIREQRKRVAEAKAGPARNKARAKLRDLERDRKRYNDGGGGLASLSSMRKHWQELQKQATVLHRYNQDIERLNALQEADRTRMATAAKTGDVTGWTRARDSRGGILATLRDRYEKALKLAKPGSNFAAELAGRLASVQGEIADVDAEALEIASPFEGGMTKDERAQLEALQAAQSLAALTAGLDDDKDAATGTLTFLERMLGAVQGDPSRGGASAVRDIADQVKQARDNVLSFSGGPQNDNADVTAQLAQRDEQLRVARREAEINARGLAAFQGAGDIGSAGWRPQIVQNINTLHPGDPATQRAVGDAAVAGMNYQGHRASPRTFSGI